MPRLKEVDHYEAMNMEHLYSATSPGRGRTLVKLDKETGDVIVGYAPPSNVGEPTPLVRFHRVAR